MTEFSVQPYIHKVKYYETDKMGIAHHSNYIRWMEEARVAFLDDVGFGFSKMETMGVVSPVVSVDCRYRTPTHFDENVEITVRLTRYTGIRFAFGYEMKNADTGALVAQAASEHCFISETGRPLMIAKVYPQIDRLLQDVLAFYQNRS